MNDSLSLLTLTAASLGFVHTILGPDHYLPFVMMSRAGRWSQSKTIFITILCGFGHVLSSVAIGAIGIAFGVALHRLEFIESVRGDIAAWLLTAFGLLYCMYGLRRAYLNKPHTHTHFHADGSLHEHEHRHKEESLEHAHAHEANTKSIMTTWALFTIFIFGPCEPLVPVLMYPAAQQSALGLVWITLVFGATTIATMLAMVLLTAKGFSFLPMKKIERYTHALAGGMIALTGFAVLFFGL